METEEETPLPPALAPNIGPPERIEVEGIVLRRWMPDDRQARFEALLASYEHLRPWMSWIQEPPTLEGQRALDELRGDAWLGEDSFLYGIFDAVDGSVLGAIGVHDRVGPGGLELGYWCHVAHTGKGVMTRAAGELTRILLELDGIERVEIHCDEANTRSAAIPQRLGYRLDRIEDDGVRAPFETGRGMVWIKERESTGARAD